MTRYVWDGNDWVDTTGWVRPKQVAPFIVSDTPAYVSPITRKVVEGRAARREDLKRSGCREVDPSEFKAVYRNPAFAKRFGKQVGGDPLPKAERLLTVIDK